MNNRNVLLINPWAYDFSCFDLWLKPLGLLSIGGMLREKGYEVHLIDCLNRNQFLHGKTKSDGTGKFFAEEIEKPKILKHIPRRYKRYGIPLKVFVQELNRIPKPQAILITTLMTYWYPAVIDIIKIIRQKFSRVPVILGGIYPTLCFEHTIKFSGADYVIKGPGELSVLKLLDELTGGISNYKRELEGIPINDFPSPAFDLYPRLDYVPILTSRGCPFKCSYCASSYLWKGYTPRKSEAVSQEIKYYHRKYKITNFAFYDDALLFKAEEHIIPILENIAKSKIEINFHTPNGMHIREINEDLAKLMFQVGFKTLRLGLETSYEERQRETGGKVNNQQFLQAVENLRKAGYKPKEIGVYILVGLPAQTKEEIIDTINFVYQNGARPILAEYSPLPGTKDYLKIKEEFILNPDIDPLLHNNSLLPYQSKIFTPQVFQEIKDYVRNLIF